MEHISGSPEGSPIALLLFTVAKVQLSDNICKSFMLKVIKKRKNRKKRK